MFKPCTILLARVSIDGRYAEDALRGLSGLGVGELLESDDVSVSEQDDELLAKCFTLQHNTETLLDFIRFHNPGKHVIKKPSHLVSCRNEKAYEDASFRQRYDFLDKCLHELVKVWGLDVDEMLSLLEKDVVLIRNESLVRQAAKMDIRPEWIDSSKSVYAFSGLANKTLLERLGNLLTGVTGGEYVILTKPMPAEYEGRVLATVVTLKEYAPILEKRIGLINCDNPSKVDWVEAQLALLDDLAKKELAFALQLKKYFGTLSPLCGEPKAKCYFESWVPEKDMRKFTEYIKDVSCGTAGVDTLEPGHNQVVPTLLDNPRVIRPFETVLEMFGLPDYGEIDPTPIIAFTIPLFFGLMFGDVGHGALVVVFGLLIAFLSKERGVRNIGYMAVSCGIASALMGFAYGSVFGETDLIAPLWMKIEMSGSIMLTLMLMVACVGILHMCLGLLLGFINALRRETEDGLDKYTELANYFFQFLMFFGLFILLSLEYTGIEPMIAFFVALLSFLIPMLLMPVIHSLPAILRRDWKALVGDMFLGVSEYFHIFLATLANSISYIRLFILTAIHEISGLIVLYLSSMASEIDVVGSALGYMIFIVGTAAILAEGFIVFIQSMRLHYYEFFSKFYGGGGVKYETLRD